MRRLAVLIAPLLLLARPSAAAGHGVDAPAPTFPAALLEYQQLGGVLMWVFGDVVFLAGMAVVVVLWMRYEERRTVRLDARLAAERSARRE